MEIKAESSSITSTDEQQDKTLTSIENLRSYVVAESSQTTEVNPFRKSTSHPLIMYMLLRNQINREDLSNFQVEHLVPENVHFNHHGLPNTHGYIMTKNLTKPSALFASKPIKTMR